MSEHWLAARGAIVRFLRDITSGTSGGIMLAMFVLLDPGDEVMPGHGRPGIADLCPPWLPHEDSRGSVARKRSWWKGILFGRQAWCSRVPEL